MRNKPVRIVPFVFTTFPLIFLVISRCVIPSGPIKTQLSVEITGNVTISPFGSISLQFSDQLQDSTIVLKLLPDQLLLLLSLEKNRKDVHVTFPQELDCNQKYALVPAGEIISQSGSLLQNTDTLHFSTGFCEIEPNNTVQTADTINQLLYGKLSSVADTDVFVIKNPTNKLIIHNIDGTFYYKVSDYDNNLYFSQILNTDTLVIPRTVNVPLYIEISSYLRSTSGYYSISVLR